ncbi:phenylacetyl-CoA ligase [Obba rivulosa]|uniref:Phenylacetyl-CoA ligase n=1 Tax=Obba rivulosa TaxID=1052685 RepID=A0A8E2DIX0_9APHY|nr:phenylacetyl-CoA ligase [Obba rivulosa]
MVDFRSKAELSDVPDNLTIPQFIFGASHPYRPEVKEDVPWLIDDSTGRRIGGEEIRTRADALANGLFYRWHIQENDVVCLFSPNHVDYPVAICRAIHKLGAAVTGANPGYTTSELTYQLELTKAKAMLVHPGNLSVALEAAQNTNLPLSHIALMEPGDVSVSLSSVHDLISEGLSRPPSFTERHLNSGEAKTRVAFLMLSSGTTGKPKAVCMSHYGAIAGIIQLAIHAKSNANLRTCENQGYRPGDVMLVVAPFYHVFGLIVVLHFGVFGGVSLVVVTKFSFVGMLKSIEHYRINHLLVVPPQVILLCKHPAVKNFDLSSVRSIISGAAPLAGETATALAQIFPQAIIGQGYGMTEVIFIAFARIDKQIDPFGSAGQLMPGVVARVVKQDGSLAGYREPGHLLISSPSVSMGYLDNDQATKETFVDGWVHTGDEVFINEEAEIFVVDRIKELIKVKGFQVAPAELEGHLLDHPDVSDACVIGIPDDYSGELPLAFVVLIPNADERTKSNPAETEKIKAALMKHVADAKVQYKHLTGGVEFIESIPKSPNGKLLRRLLRERAGELRVKG